MAEISASMVMELRQRTGLGMMECKKALTEAGGDLAKAEELLRIKSGAKASKAAGRVAAEGVDRRCTSRRTRKTGAMVEVNCETDFVARNDDFGAFASEIAQLVAARQSGRRRGARRAHARVGRDGRGAPRRRSCRRSARTSRSAASCAATPTGRLASYVHGGADRRAGRRRPAATTRSARTSRCTSRRAKPTAPVEFARPGAGRR